MVCCGEGELEDAGSVIITVGQVAHHESGEGARDSEAEPDGAWKSSIGVGSFVGAEDGFTILFGHSWPVVTDREKRSCSVGVHLDLDAFPSVAKGISHEVAQDLTYPCGVT